MRISDWSSDVCSSDLVVDVDDVAAAQGEDRVDALVLEGLRDEMAARDLFGRRFGLCGLVEFRDRLSHDFASNRGQSGNSVRQSRRSEEHTSELQSLMRISYAVFCLKKKNKHRNKNTVHNTNGRDNQT